MRSKEHGWKILLLLAAILIWVCGIQVLAEGASNDNSLSSLGILTEGAVVSPDFYYSTIEYNVTVPAGTTRLELDPVTSNENAWIVDISGQDLVDGKTTVEIVVSAESGAQYTYYLYVEEEKGAEAGAAAQTEAQTEKETEPETEPETEDPRYVKVDRNSLQEAENTISTLKKETGSYRDRISLLMKILYGLIAFCVILLFIVINLILKKKDLKAELQEYRGYGYPQDMDAGYEDSTGYDAGVGYDNGASFDVNGGYGNNADYNADDGYDNGAGYGANDGYDTVKDDPATVPKPSRAKKKAKKMPEYQPPLPEYDYQPGPAAENKDNKNVEVTMIDL